MFVVVYRLSHVINMSFANLIVEVIVGVVVYVASIIIIHAPIVDQAINLIVKFKKGKSK